MNSEKNVQVAQKAGFCFGVDRALKIVYNQLEQGKKVSILGEIIHNKDVCDKLEALGVRILTDISQLKNDETLILPSHGVPRHIRLQLEMLNADFMDATCPKVKKIHRIAENLTEDVALIMGEKDHAEIQSIVSYCEICHFIFKNSQDLGEFLVQNRQISEKNIAFFCQTTYNIADIKNSLNFLKNYCENFKTYDTICKATFERQTETVQLAENSDVMLVIGGKNSSNTRKLFEIAKKYCISYHIENVSGLSPEMLLNARRVGITAGASTPREVISEVVAAVEECEL
jgi:4-hydroxy-3-methylbut-2-enyl diphosphate reductase